MLMSRPIDRFLFAAPGIQSSPLVFLAAKKKKRKEKEIYPFSRHENSRAQQKEAPMNRDSVRSNEKFSLAEIGSRTAAKGRWTPRSIAFHLLLLSIPSSLSPDAGRNDSIFERERLN